MKRKMGLEEMAQLTYCGLKDRGIEVTLSGGACVSIYTRNAYECMDLDFIRGILTPISTVAEAMKALGFRREGSYFIHPDSDFYVEFPQPPLTVGNEAPKEVVEKILKTRRGRLAVKMLSPTDCIKDRLCQFFYWNDRQSLDLAVMVARSAGMDRDEIRRWAAQERMLEKCDEFLRTLEKRISR